MMLPLVLVSRSRLEWPLLSRTAQCFSSVADGHAWWDIYLRQIGPKVICKGKHIYLV